jgi:hypothetical protein
MIAAPSYVADPFRFVYGVVVVVTACLVAIIYLHSRLEA